MRNLPQHIQDKFVPEPMSGCWLWMASRSNAGYGFLKIAGKMVQAHRVIYEYEKGEIPKGLQIDHLCRTPSCVNPYHLEAVTPRENILRSPRSMKSHCVHGHALQGDNLVIRNRKKGGVYQKRICRTCSNSNCKKYRILKKIKPSAMREKGR